jgi:hypothetical protein
MAGALLRRLRRRTAAGGRPSSCAREENVRLGLVGQRVDQDCDERFDPRERVLRTLVGAWKRRPEPAQLDDASDQRGKHRIRSDDENLMV